MRPIATVLVLALATTVLAGCNRNKEEPSAEAKASVAAAPSKATAIAIDAEGFKANIEIPGIEFNGDKMDLDGMMLPKGSMIKGMNIKATDKGGREHGTVVFDFASPMTPDALATHLLEQAPKSSWGSFSRSTALDGAIVLRGVKHDKGDESIEYRLVADGKAASRGTATIVSDEAAKSDA